MKKGNADNGGMVQPSQKQVTPCVKWVELGLDTRGLRIVAAFWTGIQQSLQPRVLDCKASTEGLSTPNNNLPRII